MKRKKRIGTAAKAVGCAVLLMISLFPIYWLLAMAIRPTDEMRGHIALIPQSLTGMHFAQLFTPENFGQAIMNSLQTTFGSLIISLLAGICAAYVIARRRFRFGLKKPMTYWVLLVRRLAHHAQPHPARRRICRRHQGVPPQVRGGAQRKMRGTGAFRVRPVFRHRPRRHQPEGFLRPVHGRRLVDGRVHRKRRARQPVRPRL